MISNSDLGEKKMVELKLVDIDIPEGLNIIFGQSHFIKTVEDLYEAVVESSFGIKFGVAFSEASGPCLIRRSGNETELEELAANTLFKIGAGHSFIIFMKDCFPVNVLNTIKNVPEVCGIYCATANPTKVVIAESKIGDEIGRGIIGVIDGFIPKGIENKEDINWRKKFLRDIKYKL